MTQPNPRFADFVARSTRALGLPDPTVEEDSYMFRIDGRWIELKFNAARETVTMAAVACAVSSSAPLRADLVSSFNLFHLFHGGYAFVVDEQQCVVRLCRTDRLAALRPQDIRSELAAFSRTVALAGSWYLGKRDATNISEHPTPHEVI